MLTRLTSLLPAVAVAAALAAAPVQAQPGPTAQSMYADATAKEKAVRVAFADALSREALLKAVHTAVAAYERLVRRYPASGYCDNALWNAGVLSLDAFRRFGDERDFTAGVRLLKMLVSEYPSSRLAKQAPAAITEASSAGSATAVAPRAEPDRPARAAAASAPGPARRVKTIRGIDRTVLPNAIRVTIELEGEVPFYEERLDNPDRYFIDLSSTRLGADMAERTLRFDGDARPVRQIRIGRHPNDTTRIVLETAGIASCSTYAVYSPYRLVVDCIPEGQEAPRPFAGAPVATAATREPAPSPRLSASPPQLPAPALEARGAELAALPPSPIPAASAPAPEAASPVPPATAPGGTSGGADAEDTVIPATAVTASAAAAPPTAPPSRNLAGGFSIARQLGLGVSRIVVDPGHGGQDPGARSRGITEAEVVLDVALRLEKLLAEEPGVEVILTRRTDAYLPLEERTAMANREAADLFLSIHANASNNSNAAGVETYFLNFATNLSAASVAARENAASGQAMGALPDFVKAIALNNKLDESRDFATYVQRAMVQKLRAANREVKDLGVKQAPFVVLIGAAMPSVLAEISFVTNAQEARLLKSTAYRQRIAEALFEAIRKYQGSLKTVQKVAGT